jgi:uncharacterized protein involved in high-affinity Fe2+ transport
MTLEYTVLIGERTHLVKIEIPAGEPRERLKHLRDFAITTAYLEHVGYLPRGVVSAVA